METLTDLLDYDTEISYSEGEEKKTVIVKSIVVGDEKFFLPVPVEIPRMGNTSTLWLEIVKALSKKLEDLIMNPPQVETL